MNNDLIIKLASEELNTSVDKIEYTDVARYKIKLWRSWKDNEIDVGSTYDAVRYKEDLKSTFGEENFLTMGNLIRFRNREDLFVFKLSMEK